MQLEASSINLAMRHPPVAAITVRAVCRRRDCLASSQRVQRPLAMLLWLPLAICIPNLVEAQDRTRVESSASFSAGSVSPAEKVTGIGGFFFRAQNPTALAEWYERHLGVTRAPASYDHEPWRQEAGMTVLAPFPATSTFFGNVEKQWMINFRVRSLDAMVSQLRQSGIEVEVDATVHPNGRFARLTDPEGNPIQLWEDRRPETAR